MAMSPGQEATARDFYAGGLRMTEIDKPPVLAARVGAWLRHRWRRAAPRPWTTTSGPPARDTPVSLVNDLDEVVARLRARGQSNEWDGNFPGFRRVYAHDPFGNRLEFLQPSP
jgi:catechol 2,3-dioxygenase-like lactoylglutathione lyase family enzyme